MITKKNEFSVLDLKANHPASSDEPKDLSIIKTPTKSSENIPVLNFVKISSHYSSQEFFLSAGSHIRNYFAFLKTVFTNSSEKKLLEEMEERKKEIHSIKQ